MDPKNYLHPKCLVTDACVLDLLDLCSMVVVICGPEFEDFSVRAQGDF